MPTSGGATGHLVTFFVPNILGNILGVTFLPQNVANTALKAKVLKREKKTSIDNSWYY